MNSKVLKSGSDSILESEWNHDTLVDNELQCTCKVNPKTKSLFKEVIINLPIKDDYCIRDASKITSRIPLKIGRHYDLIPYEDSEQKLNIERKSYSLKILNPYLLRKEGEVIRPEDKYLLGTDTDVEGYLTLVGNLIVSTITN